MKSKRFSPWRYIRQILSGLLLIMVVPPFLFGQTNPPLVATIFDFKPLESENTHESVADFGNFETIVKQQINHRVAQLLAEKCGQRYGFLRWKPRVDLNPSAMVGATLRLFLVTHKSDFGDTVFLEFAASIGKNAISMIHIPKHQLYKAWDDQPTHDPDRLEADILHAIEIIFRSDAFRPLLHKELLRTIPLTHELHVDDADHRLIVPIQWEHLKASRKSILEVQFRAISQPEGQLKPGNISMSLEGPNFKDGWVGFVQCIIQEFSYPPIVADAWNQAIVDILVPNRIQDLDVFMDTYLEDRKFLYSESMSLDP